MRGSVGIVLLSALGFCAGLHAQENVPQTLVYEAEDYTTPKDAWLKDKTSPDRWNRWSTDVDAHRKWSGGVCRDRYPSSVETNLG